MIIEFLGCPRSGKTTTAARLFSNLKEASFNCEYVTEQARLHIAGLRVVKNLKPTDSLELTNLDQLVIMRKQLELLELMVKACGPDALVVTDTSPLNSLLYMTDEGVDSPAVQKLINQYQSLKTVTFYSKPVEWVGGLDPNRVHSKDQALAIDEKIPPLALKYLTKEPIVLLGDADIRWKHATSEVFRIITES